ncbi:MAG: cation transporter [Chloroflexi bacterium]|jgi:cation diffusion facilitator family transporter|nr:cation transporter [Chloroflexota bacterium]MBT7082159.1 cation transporter [Chloroflexota bacterium]MBT7290801.1 cation transporter [Chloroflexota bacterium]
MNREAELPDKKTGFLHTKQGVSILVIAAIGALVILQLVASFITGSISIRADAIHSVIDLAGAVVGYISIRISRKPADEDHAFGHGKAESIAGVFISILIFVAAGTILYQAIERLVEGASIQTVSLGIYVIAVSIVVLSLTSWHAMRVAKKTDSVALEAQARDMYADILSSIAVLIGLLLVRFTGWVIADAIVALLVTVLIARAAFITLKKSISGLMDTKLSDDEESAIISSVTKYGCMIAGYHKLRTRKAGSERYIDLHLTMAKNLTLEEAHIICNHIEDELENTLPGSNAIIHCEPCGDQCMECTVICTERQKS